MQDHTEAMLKSLVAIAWADGRVDGTENEVVEGLLQAFELSSEDAAVIREYAKTPRTLDELPLTELSDHDRRLLLQQAVVLSYVDGKQSDAEAAVLNLLVQKLHLSDTEANELMQAAEKRVKKLAELL